LPEAAPSQPNPVTLLNGQLAAGRVHLQFAGASGYLQSVLRVLHVPVSSQVLVLSKTSLQAALVSPQTPRALYFNDSVVVAWVPGGNIEIAAQDTNEGTVFYVMLQARQESPHFKRTDACLLCHVSPVTHDIPGLFVRSVVTAQDGTAMPQLGHGFTDHRTPFHDRWGGWYVTGRDIAFQHMGNKLVSGTENEQVSVTHPSTPRFLSGMSAYPKPTSDIVALLVLNHQAHMTNLLIHMAALMRSSSVEHGPHTVSSDGLPPESIRTTSRSLEICARELVDYMLFVDEAPWPGPARGTSSFAKEFSALGPFDHRGRSLRQLDLRHRLLSYPCSYMIYSSTFDALPGKAKQVIYRRLWEVLSRADADPKYIKLTVNDRNAILDILRETKDDLPLYFGTRYR
jgi:hypothetical protein